MVLALPRGGVPVAAEVARQLGVPLHLLVVRKIGHPANPEVAIGAVSEFGTIVLDPSSSRSVESGRLQHIVIAEAKEAKRRRQQYEPRGLPDLAGKSVILVDDGMATGMTMHLAEQEAKRHGASHVVTAVPVAPHEVAEQFRVQSDEFVCLHAPSAFFGVGAYYDAFPQLSDNDISITLHVGERT